MPRIRFSVWSLLRYLICVEPLTSPVVIRSELDRLGVEHSKLMHVTEGEFDYYLWLGD